MDKIPMTAEGYATLEAELKHCREIERPRIVQQIADARTPEDLSENVEYRDAIELQSLNEARITDLEDKLSRADVIDTSKLSGETITFGATVTVIEQKTGQKSVWKIVGEPEADVKSRKISIASPLARALIGKRGALRLRSQRQAVQRSTGYFRSAGASRLTRLNGIALVARPRLRLVP
jgi:transcription elongation factor GreA